jgi:hypothetical protein
MLLLGEQDFAASNHDSFDANSLVMVTLRQATSVENENTVAWLGFLASGMAAVAVTKP